MKIRIEHDRRKACVYLIFNEGYTVTADNELIRGELCDEAIWLTHVLTTLLAHESLLAVLPEALGLHALMLLHDARRDARVGTDGELVLLEEQNRTLWNEQKTQEGLDMVDRALHLKRVGPYQIQAAIAALHMQAKKPEETDWTQIAALYRILMRMIPSPVIELNRVVAIAMVNGPLPGLALLDRPELEQSLHDYYLFHTTPADLLRRTGRREEASVAYAQALPLCHNEKERSFLKRRLAEVSRHV